MQYVLSFFMQGVNSKYSELTQIGFSGLLGYLTPCYHVTVLRTNLDVS